MTSREEFITALRQLADFLTVNPDVPVPAYPSLQVCAIDGTDDDKCRAVDRAALAMGAEAHDPRGDGRAWKATLRFGPIEYSVVAHTSECMRDWADQQRLGQEALAAKKAAELPAEPTEEYVTAPFVKATPAEVAEAYASSATAATVHFEATELEVAS